MCAALRTNTYFEVVKDDIIHEEALSKALAAKKIDKDKDLMYVKFRYVHEGANKNNDVFIAEELEKRHTTAMFKPINWQHKDSDIVGTIYDTEFISREDSNNGKAAVNIYGVIYKWLFPEKAEIIEKRYEEGNLNISMETWFDEAECTICGETYASEKDYCSHLKARYSVADNKRILKGITFGGAGIVENPADEDANGLAVAKELKDKVSKRQEFTQFETIMHESVNIFYDIYWMPSYTKEETDAKKARLKELFTDLKNMVDTINVNKIAKGENVVEDKDKNVSYPQDVVDALIEKAKADKSDEFAEQLNVELNNVRAEMQEKIDALISERDEAVVSKEAAEKKLVDIEEQAKQDKLLAERRKALVEKNIEIAEDKNPILLGMSEEAFALFIEANAKVKAEEEEDEPEEEFEDEPESSEASLKINDKDKDNKNDADLVKAALKNL